MRPTLANRSGILGARGASNRHTSGTFGAENGVREPAHSARIAPNSLPRGCLRDSSQVRSDDNDLVIKGNLISRIHCRVEISREKFLIVDQSTNGTFIITRQGEELFVRRDSVQLSGEGVIGLGRVVQPGSAQAIHFIQED